MSYQSLGIRLERAAATLARRNPAKPVDIDLHQIINSTDSCGDLLSRKIQVSESCTS